MLGRVVETWSTPQYDATRFSSDTTAYMHSEFCNYHFHSGTHGIEQAQALGHRWADEIHGEYKEPRHGDGFKVIVTDRSVAGRRQGRRRRS